MTTPGERRARLHAIEHGSPELRAAEQRGDRYYVVSVTGYRINPSLSRGRGSTSCAPSRSYSVLDRFFGFREVARFTPVGSRDGHACESAALRECERLNRRERARAP